MGRSSTTSDSPGHFRIAVPRADTTFSSHAENRIVRCADRSRMHGRRDGRVTTVQFDQRRIHLRPRHQFENGRNGHEPPRWSDPFASDSSVRHSRSDERSRQHVWRWWIGTGHFTLRAAPGENFPYFVNIRGDRMAWDTREKPAVVVKDGETTNYDMLITPEVSPADKLKAAQKVVADLPKEPKAANRTNSRRVSQAQSHRRRMRALVYPHAGVGRDRSGCRAANLRRIGPHHRRSSRSVV